MKRGKRIMSAMILISLLLPSSPNIVAVHAESLTPDQSVQVSTSSEVDGQNTNIEVNVALHNVDRTVSELDAVKINYNNNTYNMDYKPKDVNEKIEKLLPEIKLADIIEHEGLTQGEREQLTIKAESGSEYAGKVKYLIENNIINRNTYFLIDSLGIFTSFRRIINPTGKDDKIDENNSKTSPLFYNSEDSISKTDFLVHLMKSSEVLSSKPLVSQSDYTRISETLENVRVQSEPIEKSIYSKYMGELGIDPNSHDVVINHSNFRQLNVMLASDVTEQYLDKALSLNIINGNEVGGVEGELFLTQQSNLSLKDGWKSPNLPARQFYNPLKTSDKLFGDRIVYQKEQYENALTNQGIAPIGSDCLDGGILNIWGSSYSYNKSKCAMVNPYSKVNTEIVKRPSSVQAREGFISKKSSGEVDKGYQYFKEEEISVAESYIIAYQFLKSIGYEPTELNPEYVNTMFSLNLTSFTEEERKATEYLIASGVVNGDDPDLSNATSNQLTNKHAVDLVYRIKNKDARYQYTENLTEVDKDMANRGFSRANVSVGNNTTQETNIYFEDATTTNEDGSRTNYRDKQILDRIKNTYQYDMVYVRIPKYMYERVSNKIDSEGNLSSDGYFSLVTNDGARIKIDPINERAFNGGSGGERLIQDITNLKAGEEIYDNPGGRFVFKDKDEFYWHRYLIHKDISNKVSLTSFSSKGTVTLGGFSGEGVYFIEEGSTHGNMQKLKLNEAKDNTNTERIYDALIEHDLKTRVKMQTEKIANTEVQHIGNKKIFWRQSSFADPTLTGQMTAVYSSVPEERMSMLTYKGKQMMAKTGEVSNGANGWEIKDNLPMDTDVRRGYSLKVNSAGTYDILYTGITQSEIEGYSELNFVKKGDNYDPNASVSLGYAKINANGTSTVIISEDELPYFGIERAKKKDGEFSDKSLFNKKTGQRAFLDTDLSMTLIGNNISHYKKDHMMVLSVGGTLYYNLEILMELINDTSAVHDRIGKEVLVGTSTGIDGTEEHQLTPIVDILMGGHSDGTIIDNTYVMAKKPLSNTGDIYMNLSAMTSSASNFLYYKNRDGLNDFEALVVYRPNVGEDVINHTPTGTNSRRSTFTENGIINAYDKSKINSRTKKSVIDVENQASTKDNSFAKKLTFDKLFKMDNGVGAQVLQGDYKLDVYVINNSTTTGAHTESIKNFLTFVTDGNEGTYKKFLESTEHDRNALGIDMQTTLGSNQKGLFKLDFINAGNTVVESSNFLTHKSTGNLYYKITANGGNNFVELQKIVGQRFYYDKLAKKIKMRRKEYFESTPDKYIPLEIYAKTGSKQFGALESTDDGSIDTNFPNKIHKLSISSEDNNNREDANVSLPIVEEGVADYGLMTRLEVPFRILKKDDINKFISTNVEKSAVSIFEETIKMFSQKIYNGYPVRNAMGYIEEQNTVSVGYMNDLSRKSKLSFMVGSWGGKDGGSSSYYVPKMCADTSTCGHLNHYTLTVGDDILGGTNGRSNVRFYLNQIKNGTIQPLLGTYKTERTFPIRDFTDLPNDIKTLMASNGNVELPIYYKPSLAIPAGTTLVNIEGDLIFSPNEKIRGNLNHSTDIINNMLARMQELNILDNVQLLGEADKHSAVKIGDRIFIKLSDKQNIDAKSSMKWERMLMIPKTDTNGNYEEYPKSRVNEAMLMLMAMTDLESITLPMQNGIGETRLIDILGPGRFRIPEKTEIKDVFKIHNSKSAGISTNLYLDKIQNMFLIEDAFGEFKGTRKYGVSAFNIDADAVAGNKPLSEVFNEMTSGKAIPMNVVYLPPTIQLEDTDGLSEHYTTYRAIKYWDISAFNVDQNDSVINILRGHDTEAETIDGILDSIRKSGSDGTYYTKYTFMEFVRLMYEWVTGFLLRGIPIIITFIWLFVTLVTVVFGFNKTKEWGDNLNKRMGKDIISKLSLGVVDVYAETFSWHKYIVSSFFIWMIVFILWDGYVLKLAIAIFMGDGSLISALKEGFRSVFSN